MYGWTSEFGMEWNKNWPWTKFSKMSKPNPKITMTIADYKMVGNFKKFFSLDHYLTSVTTWVYKISLPFLHKDPSLET